ncbi:MAG: hypothetical protein KGJ82_18365 [Nitrospirota bacterium]|nr:hypothetical protein [Nitrospirota bacterium]
MKRHGFGMSMISTIAILLLGTAVSAQDSDSSALDPRTGPAIQGDFPLPSQARRGRCNPALTRCQLPRHRVQPKDSDLNARTESGRRLDAGSLLNNQKRTGPALDDPAIK